MLLQQGCSKTIGSLENLSGLDRQLVTYWQQERVLKALVGITDTRRTLSNRKMTMGISVQFPKEHECGIFRCLICLRLKSGKVFDGSIVISMLSYMKRIFQKRQLEILIL